LIKLDAKYYYNVTLYKSFINKVYDLVGQPWYTTVQVYKKGWFVFQKTLEEFK